jgi:ABC-2 type transport system ATP-binding protein
MPLVVAENLSKSYGRIVAVQALSLKMSEGSIVGLVGPNGAGKTTTIKMILGLLKPDKGHVDVFGQNPWDNPDVHSKVGVVYEKPYFPTSEKVLDYLERVCRVFGVNEAKAMETLKLVNLEDACNRTIRALSAGMLQKFAIAHAIVHEPEFVIADEVTSNLDPKARSSLLDLIIQLHKNQKATFLLSSHILPELSRVCDSAVILNKGKVCASGSLTELYEKFTAKTVRVSTDEPEKLAEAVRKLPYVEKIETESQGICIKIAEGGSDTVYEDISRLAREVKAKIHGMETAGSSLEELYTLAVDSGGQ